MRIATNDVAFVIINNRYEKMPLPIQLDLIAVLWRKRSNGTQSEKGNRWVERLLSFRQTCRLRAQATFPLLADAVKAYFKEQTLNPGWLA